MIHVIAQLPLKERYTLEWYKKLDTIEGYALLGNYVELEIDRSKSYNYFTNLEDALNYEADQIVRAADLNNLDTLLITDLDFPGMAIQAVPVLRLKHEKMKVYGILHAGSWCNGDLFSGNSNKKKQERLYFDLCELIFVATHYHRYKINTYFGEQLSNIVVLDGMPFYANEIGIPHIMKSRSILVLGRPEQTGDISDAGWQYIPELQMDFHTEWIERKTYMELLSRYLIVIIPKQEETFGYAAFEAIAMNTIPLVPDAYSYSELLPAQIRYSSVGELMMKTERIIQDDQYRERVLQAIQDIDMQRFTLIFDKIKNLISMDQMWQK